VTAKGVLLFLKYVNVVLLRMLSVLLN